MKHITRILTAIFIFCSSTAGAQTYGKLNAAYALAGIVNPQLEMTLSKRMTFQTDIVFCPWKSIRWKGANYPMRFLIVSNDVRWFFRAPADGWYAGVVYGVQGFNMTKPTIFDTGKFGLEGHSGKGWGVQVGAVGGYQWTFAKRWLLDAFVGFGYQISWYNSYNPSSGLIELYPHGHDPTLPPDPWNASAEWGINKFGVSVGYMIFGKR